MEKLKTMEAIFQIFSMVVAIEYQFVEDVELLNYAMLNEEVTFLTDN
jgi:hypothetical protein